MFCFRNPSGNRKYCCSAGQRWQVHLYKSPRKKSQVMSSHSVRSTKTRITLGLFYFFFETSFSFKMFFLPVYWQQLGLSPTQIGILRAVWDIAYSLGAVIFGKMASKWKIRRALLLMSVLSTAITPLVSLLPRRIHDKCLEKLRTGSPEQATKRRTTVFQTVKMILVINGATFAWPVK